MKYSLSLLILTSSFLLSGDVYVDGYTRSDGTYVEGHYRSSPNDTVSDNFSTDGNVNPYTGEEGTREVYDDGSYAYADDSGENYSSSQLTSSGSDTVESDNTSLIVLGVIGGLVLLFTILKVLGRYMFFSYLIGNIKFAFTTWIVLTLLNQIVFFGACLAPYCILASIPHVSLITIGIVYLSYASARDTYDPQTGYNKFGYNKEGYDHNGYDVDGFDKNGYNSQGFDRDGKDRLGKGSIGRFFAGDEHHQKISKMNEEARNAKAVAATTPIVEQKAISSNKPMSEMDRFFNEPKKEISKVNVEISTEQMLKELGIDSATRAAFDAKTAKLQKELVDFKSKKRSESMPVRTDNNPLNNYKNVSDQSKDIKNFRLYFKDKPTNLVWYGGKIIYVPKDYFLMKNLTNINHATGRKCILYKPDIDLMNEMKEKNIVFTLAEDIQELMDRLNASGLNIGMLLSDELGIETTSDVDYSEYNEPIYDQDNSWKIKY